MVMRPDATSSVETDQVVVLHAIPWEQYESLTKAIGESAGIRTSYLDGELEILSPGRHHEHWKTLLARLVEAWADAHELPLNGFGSETFRKRAKKAGLEPDECYIVGEAKKVPDLAVEVVWSNLGIDKLEVYRRIGIGEVWFWEEGKLLVFGLEKGSYKRLRASRLLKGFPLRQVEQIVATTDFSHQAEAVRKFRRSL